MLQQIARGYMRPAADEQVVDAVQALAVVQLGLGQRHLTHLPAAAEHLRQQQPQILDGEREQHAVPAQRIRVHPD
ncbi:hypothetical protein D3C76_1700820 [compost metagenome]